MASVIDHYGDNQDVIIANAGPGHWNDPDMVRMFNLLLIFFWTVETRIRPETPNPENSGSGRVGFGSFW